MILKDEYERKIAENDEKVKKKAKILVKLANQSLKKFRTDDYAIYLSVRLDLGRRGYKLKWVMTYLCGYTDEWLSCDMRSKVNGDYSKRIEWGRLLSDQLKQEFFKWEEDFKPLRREFEAISKIRKNLGVLSSGLLKL